MAHNYYVIDGNAYLYRAFFAIPKFSTKSGIPTNAVYGFTKMLLKLLKDRNNDTIVVAFDHKGKNFRNDAYEGYKEHREKMPDELIGQLPYIKQIVPLLGLPVMEIEGVEADDAIGTFVEMHKQEPESQIFIITGDKDMMQLVNHKVFVLDTMKNVRYGREEVKKKMGVFPEQITDLLGLMGDSSDNIPGVPGVGPKTATTLLEQYETLENVLAHGEDQKGALKEKLLLNKELAIMSKELATIKKDVDLSHLSFPNQAPQFTELFALAESLELRTIVKEIREVFHLSTEEAKETGTSLVKQSGTTAKIIASADDLAELIKKISKAEHVGYIPAYSEKDELLSIDVAFGEKEPCYRIQETFEVFMEYFQEHFEIHHGSWVIDNAIHLLRHAHRFARKGQQPVIGQLTLL